MASDSNAATSRSVFIIARPLRNQIFPLLGWASHSSFFLCHWAVLVSEWSQEDISHAAQSLMPSEYTKAKTTVLGILWQICWGEDMRNQLDMSCSFTLSCLKEDWIDFSIIYLGVTVMTNDQITLKGTRITAKSDCSERNYSRTSGLSTV